MVVDDESTALLLLVLPLLAASGTLMGILRVIGLSSFIFCAKEVTSWPLSGRCNLKKLIGPAKPSILPPSVSFLSAFSNLSSLGVKMSSSMVPTLEQMLSQITSSRADSSTASSVQKEVKMRGRVSPNEHCKKTQ